jgi:hypothetical protein
LLQKVEIKSICHDTWSAQVCVRCVHVHGADEI